MEPKSTTFNILMVKHGGGLAQSAMESFYIVVYKNPITSYNVLDFLG